MKNIIVCSSKPWNKKYFDKQKKKGQFKWIYISTPNELNLVLKNDDEFFSYFTLELESTSKIVKNYTCICFHMTDLPYGRGGSPLQNLILDGKNTMITAFRR